MDNIPTLTDIVLSGDAAKTLVGFRALSQDEKRSVIAALIVQHCPWLRRGDDMEGPVGVFKDGKRYEPSLYYNGEPTVAERYSMSPRQLTGHPCLRLPQLDGDFKQVKQRLDGYDADYFHINEVKLVTPFGDAVPSDEVHVKGPNDTNLVYVLTQQDIDENTTIQLSIGVSR